MQFQVTEIFFDFDDPDDEITLEEYNQIVAETCNTIWEVNFEDELSDAITDATGWCIKSIDYSEVSK